MQDHRFSIKFQNGWLKGSNNFTKSLLRKSFINIIKNCFGFYEVWESKILSEPKQIGDGEWEYKLKVLRIKKYFLWICYANRAWNTIKERGSIKENKSRRNI